MIRFASLTAVAAAALIGACASTTPAGPKATATLEPTRGSA